MGVPGHGRTSFLVQVAEHAAHVGHPVLFVLTAMGQDEAVARLLVMRNGRRGFGAVLQDDARAHTEACARLVHDLASLHLWTPSAAQRTADQLAAKVRAASEAHDGRPPLVLLDSVTAWNDSIDSDELSGALRDLVHTASLSEDWPGAAVLALCPPEDPAAFRDGATLRRALEAQSSFGCELEDSATLVLAIATDPGADERSSRLAIVRDRHSNPTVLRWTFDTAHGTFAPGPVDPAPVS